MRIPWKRIAQVVILLLALGFIAALVRSQWSALRSYHWQVAPGWALLALLGLELTWVFEAGTWNRILAGLGGHLRQGRALRAWFVSNIIRYIPGNVWQFLGMAELAAEDGVPRPVTLASIILHQAVSTATGLALAALYFALAGQGHWFAALRPLLLLIPLGLFLLQPRILEAVLNWGLRRLRRPPLRVTLTGRAIGWIILRYVVVWFAEGLSFVAMVRALTPFGWPAVPHLAAAWTGAYIIGYLSLITPSGLGVREAVMVVLLGTVLPAPVAAVVALATRLWMVLAELAGAGATLAVGRWRGDRPAIPGGESAGQALPAAAGETDGA
jgi:uncharacterized membrane protein YbhN (UPF0104 family)